MGEGSRSASVPPPLLLWGMALDALDRFWIEELEYDAVWSGAGRGRIVLVTMGVATREDG